jgi:hypothetical protein
VDALVVERLLDKLREFIAEQLDPEERAVLAALLAPAVAAAYGESEVAGFGSLELAPLPEALATALERAGIRVIGLDEVD